MIYDLIATVYKPSGVLLKDSEDNEYQEMVKVEGYHVNCIDLTTEEMTKVKVYIVEPTQKQRVFAGRDDTICLKFKDRDEWLSLGVENVEDLV